MNSKSIIFWWNDENKQIEAWIRQYLKTLPITNAIFIKQSPTYLPTYLGRWIKPKLTGEAFLS